MEVTAVVAEPDSRLKDKTPGNSPEKSPSDCQPSDDGGTEDEIEASSAPTRSSATATTGGGANLEALAQRWFRLRNPATAPLQSMCSWIEQGCKNLCPGPHPSNSMVFFYLAVHMMHLANDVKIDSLTKCHGSKRTTTTNGWFKHMVCFMCVAMALRELPKCGFSGKELTHDQKIFLSALIYSLAQSFIADLRYQRREPSPWVSHFFDSINGSLCADVWSGTGVKMSYYRKKHKSGSLENSL